MRLWSKSSMRMMFQVKQIKNIDIIYSIPLLHFEQAIGGHSVDCRFCFHSRRLLCL
jgi:hypothetical protein